MLRKFLNQRSQRKKLTNQLAMLNAKKDSLTGKLAKTKQGNNGNARNSDRKFKENRAKALSARAKRANKSSLLELERQIKFLEIKLKQFNEKNGTPKK